MLSECLGTPSAKLDRRLRLRKYLKSVLRRVMGPGLFGTLGMGIYNHADALITLNAAEQHYMINVYGAAADRTHVIPNAVHNDFFPPYSTTATHSDTLLYPGYISARKNQLEVARAAKRTCIPIHFFGGAQSHGDAYFDAFKKEIDNRWIRRSSEANNRKK